MRQFGNAELILPLAEMKGDANQVQVGTHLAHSNGLDSADFLSNRVQHTRMQIPLERIRAY
jgi:hypothetical protein